MKTKIILLIGAVALVTLSFTFITVDQISIKASENITNPTTSQPVGGLFADEVAE